MTAVMTAIKNLKLKLMKIRSIVSLSILLSTLLSAKHLLKLSVLIIIISFTTGCSKDDDSDQKSENSSLVSGINKISSGLNATTNMIVPSVSTSSFKGVVAQATKIDSVWTTSGGVTSLSNSGSSPLKDWIGNMFDPSFVNSNNAKVTFAGRISNSMMVLCILGAAGLATDGTGLPSDGTHSITLTSTMLTTCGESSTSSLVGSTVSMTVSTLSDTSLYDKSFSIALPGSESCPFKFLVRANSAAVNIATGEDQNCDGRDQASGSVVRLDLSSHIFRFTYVSQAFSGTNAGFEFYRGYYDQTADQAYVLGFYGSDTSPSTSPVASNLNNYVAFTAVGKPTAGGTVAVSAKVKGMTLSDDTYNGCINSSDGSVASTTATLACTMTGVSMDDPTSSPYTKVTDAYTSHHARTDIYSIGATTDVGFSTSTDMLQ